ncbi:MAG: SpoIIE family protein phosphatase [Polyangia bacterium]|jgi:serine phosphatase RsbU (regulator of sigma subunit)|nr:SpoIIE family protein phosphatase [Polyangia bacterium]
MATRRGASISLKMILTTTFLILVIVGLFGFLSILNIQDIYDEQARRQQEIFEGSTREHGASQIDTLAEGLTPGLKVNEYSTLHGVLTRAKARDVLVRHIWLLDSRGRRVASSEAADNREFQKVWDENPEALKPFSHELIPADFMATISGKAPAHSSPRRQGAMTPQGAADAMVPAEMEGAEAMAPAPPSPSAPAPQGASENVNSLVRDFSGDRVMVVGKALSSEGVVLGTLLAVYSLQRLQEQLVRIRQNKERAFSKAWQHTAMIGVLFFSIGLLLAIFQGVRISKPIRNLTFRATQIAQGDLQTRVEVTTRDELGQLAEHFNFMADQLLILMQDSAKKGAVQKELEVARNIQETLVPPDELVDKPFLRLSGYFEPASECGGDWWTYHEIDEGKILVVIADVTGHGVPSAMITATAKSAVDTLRAVTKDKLTVTYLLEVLNRAILESAKRKFVMTCFASIIDPKNQTITFANAGHNFPYIYRTEAGQGKFNVLMTRGNRLGDLEESTYEAKQERLLPGDVIVWYTDGIIECESEMGEEYGEKRFRASIRKLSEKEPDEIRDGVVQAAQSFFGNMPHKDDITMVVGRFYEPGTAPPLKAASRRAQDETAGEAPAEPGSQESTPTPKEMEA